MMNQFIPNIKQNGRKKFQKNLKAIKGINSKANTLSFGNLGFRFQEGFFLKDFHFKTILDTSKRIIKKFIKDKDYNIVFRFFPNKSETKKVNSRMGGGKGDIENWSVGIKKGSIFVEYANIKNNKLLSESLYKQLSAKMPVPISLVIKDDNGIEQDIFKK